MERFDYLIRVEGETVAAGDILANDQQAVLDDLLDWFPEHPDYPLHGRFDIRVVTAGADTAITAAINDEWADWWAAQPRLKRLRLRASDHWIGDVIGATCIFILLFGGLLAGWVLS